MSRVSVAIVQHPPVFLNLAASVDRAEALAREAAADGAAIVVFPEAWLPGYPVWLDESPRAASWDHAPAAALFRRLFENSPELDGPEIARLRETAIALNSDIVIGVHERRGASLFNSVVRLACDGIVNVHRKIMPTYNERLIWAAADGSTLAPWQSRHGPLGALICWEHWMPLARAAMHAAGEVIHFALWPAVGDLHQLASRHYAFEGQCFVVAAGTLLSRADVLDGFDSSSGDPAARGLLEAIPSDRTVLKAGGSAVIGPDANYVAAPLFDELGIIHTTLDLARTTEGRLYLDTVGHYSRPDIFELIVDRRPKPGVSFLPGDMDAPDGVD